LCEQLQTQIINKRNERKKEVEQDKKDFENMMRANRIKPSTVCPHGKIYKCAHCEKAFPRKYLNTMTTIHH